MFKLLKRIVIAIEKIADQGTFQDQLEDICKKMIKDQSSYNLCIQKEMRKDGLQRRLEFLEIKSEFPDTSLTNDEKVELEMLKRKFKPEEK